MIDINFIRNNEEKVKKSMQDRGFKFDFDLILSIDEERRELMQGLQNYRSHKNNIASQVAIGKKNNIDVNQLLTEGDEIGEQIKLTEIKLEEKQQQLDYILHRLPNILHESTPIGKDETENTIKHYYGKKPEFNFAPKKHYEILGSDYIDFETAVKISGSRFVLLKGHLARLERALKNFMLDIHTKEFGYTEMSVPFLVNKESVFSVGHLPSFEEDMFITKNDFYLISTAEVPLTNVVRGEMLKPSDLPIRVTAFSSCFRSEAGSSGKDTKGMIRQHQFQKVELVSITEPDKSEQEHERMLTAAEEILKRLGLHYRVVNLCSGDIGFCSQKTFDIEVWLPGEDRYREISSCSNMGSFQAKRMQTKVKFTDGSKEFVHTLNGSGLAIGRTIVAILENYQEQDGSVIIPEKLVPYMDGVTKIDFFAR